MASALQHVGALNQKACTFSFGAPAAAKDNAGAARVPLFGRPGAEFTKSFLAGSSGFSLNTGEQLQTGFAAKAPVLSVRAAARDLLPRPPQGQTSTGLEMKQCLECKRGKPLVDFEKAGKGLKRSCRACVAVHRAERAGKEMAHMALSVEESWKRAKPCVKCGLVKELRDFAIDNKATDRADNSCRACKASERHVLTPQVGPKDGGPKTIETLSQYSKDVGAPRESLSDFSESGYSSGEEGELSLERQFEVTKNIWENLLAEEEELDVFVPDVIPASADSIQKQTRSIDSGAASETIAALQVKLLRLDFDLSHARATKAVFSDQVQYLERVMSDSTEENGKMKVALDEASSSISELEKHVHRLEEEGRNLRGRLLRLDFDLTHSRATRSILGNRVEDLERAILQDKEASRIRDEQLSTALAEAAKSNAALRAHVEAAQSEASQLKSKVLNFSLDLDHARFGNSTLGNKVTDLEKSLSASEEAYLAREEGVRRALEESNAAIAELESLRQSHNTLLTKSIRSDFDLEHHKYGKKLLNEKVADLERVVNDIREEDSALKAVLAKATASNVELESQVAGLQEEQSKLKTQVLNFSFDLTHSGATRGILGERVKDLERVVSEQNEQAQIRDENLRTALADTTKAIAEVHRLESEGGALKSKLLRLDFDLAHARAHKQILGEKVDQLERLVDELRTDDATLRASLAEAVSSNARMESEVTNLQLESTNLKNKVLHLSLDLTHAQAGRSILSGKVQDLEKELHSKQEQAQKDLERELRLKNDQAQKQAQTQEEKLQAAHAVTAKLEAEVERMSTEEGKLVTRILRQDFDLAHITALKSILEKRVADIDVTIAARDKAETNMKAAFAARDHMQKNLAHLMEQRNNFESQSQRQDRDITHLRANLEEQRNKFQSQSLRKDFDITHLRAVKAILSDRVADLERVVAAHAEIGEKLKDANVDKAELEAEVDRLTEEGRSLQSKLLRKDFDMTHTRALKAILHTRVEDLEKSLAESLAEQNSLGPQLAEAKGDKAKLESDVKRLDMERSALQSESMRKDFDLQRLDKERNALQSESIRKDFDLQHFRALKALLEDKVSDLQRVAEDHTETGLKLKDATLTNAALEAELQRLETQEGALRSQMLARDFDLTHTRHLKTILHGRVADLEKVIEGHTDQSEQLTAFKSQNAHLGAQLQRLEEREGELLSQSIGKDFDLTHYRAMKAILEGRVEDLQKVIATHEDLSEKLKASHLANADLERQVETLGTEGHGLKNKLLLQDLDLTNTRELKKILNDKVLDLERVIANHDDMGAKLRASKNENVQLEGQVASLEEKEGSLQSKLLRKEFDLQHYHALKTILDDKVQGLEKALTNLDEAARIRDEKLRIALAESSASTAEAAALKEETSTLKYKLLETDFDLTHAKAGKAILNEKVQDLERVLANYDKVALARDASLAEALSSVANLEAEVARLEQERGDLQSKNIRMDFDLAHAKATRAILGEKVVDLATQGEKLSSALTQAITTKAELENKVGKLGEGLKAVLREERSLRDDKAELKRQLFNLQIDNLSLHRSTERRTGMLQEKQQKLAELEESLRAAKNEAATLSRQLEVAVTQSGGSKETVNGKETVGEQLAQIATLTASVQKEGGKRVRIAETDEDTDDEVVAEIDEDTDDEVVESDDETEEPVVSTPEPAKSEEGGVSGKGLASAGLSVLLVLALGGSMLFHPNAAHPQIDSEYPRKETAPKEQVVEVNERRLEVNERRQAPSMEQVMEVNEINRAKLTYPAEQAIDVNKINKAMTSAAVIHFPLVVNPVEHLAAVMELDEVGPVEDLALLEVTTATGPTAEQQAEEMSLVEEMSSKLFDATPSTSNELEGYDAPRSVFNAECGVDMC